MSEHEPESFDETVYPTTYVKLSEIPDEVISTAMKKQMMGWCDEGVMVTLRWVSLHYGLNLEIDATLIAIHE